MKKLRSRFERFCYNHQDWGIPNLMLWICLGGAVLYLVSAVSKDYTLYSVLCFDKDRILMGEVWRLFSYVLTLAESSNIFLTLVVLICYYSLGRAVENRWGTLRFNLFYLSGVVLMDVFAMIFSTYYTAPLYMSMGSYLNLSLLIAYATLYPETHFMIFFIIPIKAWVMALLYLGLTVFDVFQLANIGLPLPHYLFPLVGLANYFLFFGKDVLSLIPVSWQVNARRVFKPKGRKKSQKPKVIPFNAGSWEASTATPRAPYTHKCAVCGRTDVSDPDLEFRYCSRCNGYYCYCEDHISNHTHIQ